MSAEPLFPQLFQQPERKDLFAEVTPVQGSVEDRLVNLLELAKGKLQREKAIDDVGVMKFGAKPLEGETAHLIVVIGEVGNVIGGKPPNIPIL